MAALPSNSNPNETWEFLEPTVRKILMGSGVISAKERMSAYTAIHDVCLSQRQTGNGGAITMGAELYERLEKYLRQYLYEVQQKIMQHSDDELVKSYFEEWHQYQKGALQNKRIFLYLNRGWVWRKLDEREQQLHEVYVLHFVLWKVVVLQPIDRVLKDTLLQLEAKHQKGEDIDESIIKNIVEFCDLKEKHDTDADVKKEDGRILSRIAQEGHTSTVEAWIKRSVTKPEDRY